MRARPLPVLAALLAAVPAARAAEVGWKGSLRAVHSGDGSAQVELAPLLATPHLYAVGPLAHYAGEVTVLDGVPHLARSADGRLVTSHHPGAPASFLVWAYVPRWSPPVKLVRGPDDRRGLDDLVEEAARRAGLDLDRPFPFLLGGTFSSVDLHVLVPAGARPAAQGHDAHGGHGGGAPLRLALRDVRGTAVGFYSRKHEGIFTHRGSRTHVHFVGADERSGHVDALVPGDAVEITLPGSPSPLPLSPSGGEGGGEGARR